jgi:hypothetical protein
MEGVMKPWLKTVTVSIATSLWMSFAASAATLTERVTVIGAITNESFGLTSISKSQSTIGPSALLGRF